MSPKKGDIAVCRAGSLGLITSNEKRKRDVDGEEAWFGIHLTGKLEHAEPGDTWTSRNPEVIGNAGDLIRSANDKG